MLFWFAVFLLSLLGVGAIAWPVANAGGGLEPEATPADRLKARLAEIEQDQAAGLIEEGAIEAAILEAKKHALTSVSEPAAPAPARFWRMAALFSMGAAPLAAVVIYLNIGAPASLQKNSGPATSSIAQTDFAGERISSLEAFVKSAPDDIGAWMELGQAYVLADRANDAARALSRAVALDGTSADAHSALGEALVMQADGAVTAEARNAFEKALAMAPGDARSRYYLAEARYQVGAIEEAVRQWAALANDAPADAPWLAAVGARMTDAANEAGLDMASIGLEEATGQRLVALMRGEAVATDDELSEVAGRMHDGSASYEDWLRAAAIYAERGEIDRAREILERAAERYQAAPFVMVQINIAKASLENGEPIAPSSVGAQTRGPTTDQAAAVAAMSENDQKAMIEGMVAGLAARLEAEPDDIEGWRMLARSYRVLGQPQKSLDAYKELLKHARSDPEDWRGYAMSLLAVRPEGDDSVSDELAGVLEKLQSFDQDDPLALYHLGFAARQHGDPALAVRRWRRLLETMSADVPLRPTLERLIAETENS